MKIATWNVNSVRARKERLIAWLAKASPDVLCLQELKCIDEGFPTEEILAAGYHSVTFGQKTYNGVAILSKVAPTDVRKGFDDAVDDAHARFLSAEVGGVRVISVYVPNGQEVDSPAYVYKLEWLGRLRRYLDKHHRPEEPLVVCGDFNVAPDSIDVHDPAAWEGQTLFTVREREALKEAAAFGLKDTFREKHPGVQKFSWWDYRMLGFPKNRGLRIDHLFATSSLLAKCTEVEIDREERKGKLASDHAPVWATFG